MSQSRQLKVLKAACVWLFAISPLISLLGPIQALAQSELRLYVESGIHHSARAVVFSPTARYVATGSLDRTIKIWDATTTRELRTLPNGAMSLFLVFSPDERLVVSSNEDGRVSLWDIRSGVLLQTLPCSRGRASIAIDRQGRTLYCADEDAKKVRRWSFPDLKALAPLDVGAASSMSGWTLDEEGEHLLGRVANGDLSILRLSTGQLVSVIPGAGSSESVSYVRQVGLAAVSSGTGLTVWSWGPGGRGPPAPVKSIALQYIHAVALSTSSPRLAVALESGDVVVFSTDDWSEVDRFDSSSNRVERTGLVGEASTLATQVWYDTKLFLDLKIGALVDGAVDSPGGELSWKEMGAFGKGQFRFVNRGNHVRVEDQRGEEIGSIVFLDKKRQWIVASPDGRFDTNIDLLKTVKGAHWFIGDDYFAPLPLEIFMRDYFEPKLLPRLLGLAGGPLLPLPPIINLNTAQPRVSIESISSTRFSAVVKLRIGKSELSAGRPRASTFHDLRLFRNGQLVGQWPEPKASASGPHDLEAWRKASLVPMEPGQTKAEHTFKVALPSKNRGKPVVFTAYAFNEDRVKSETARSEFVVPVDMPLRKPRAYVITVGVNSYELKSRDLSFAAKDAKDLGAALARIKDHEVVRLTLVSEDARPGAAATRQATKANVRSVLELLAGKSESERARLKGVPGIDAKAIQQLRKATPDDVVVIAFSGHGYIDRASGQFYLLPSDSGKDPGKDQRFGPGALSRFVSSEELSQWLREVDAGQMAMIIDACHSASAVDQPGFKPGPMGDRGLGQLAYDKGMMILAATQASDVALEVQKVKQGLLTYALVADGFKQDEGKPARRNADIDRDGVLSLREWLQYGERRVPALYEDIRAGKVSAVHKDPRPDSNETTAARAQTPSLFDFQRRSNNAEFAQ